MSDAARLVNDAAHPLLLAADSIGKSFGFRAVLKSASAWAWRGRATVLLGRNGSGKSTLMRIAAGVLAPDHGAVRIGDETFTRPRLSVLAARGLYYLPDRGGLPIDRTLRMLLGIVQRRFHTTSAVAAAEALGLGPLLDVPIIELSGGEQKRAEVAVAIARAPRILIADEPFAGISPLDAEQVAAAFRALRDNGCALVVSGHEVPALLELADEIVWVTSGTTHALGSPAHALAHHQFCREYLGIKAVPLIQQAAG